MPSLLLSSQEGAEGQEVLTRPGTRFLGRATQPENQASKALRTTITIGKALERLNLSVAEREAWEWVKEHLSERDQEREPRADAPNAYGIRELREEIQALTSTVGKLAEGSKKQS